MFQGAKHGGGWQIHAIDKGSRWAVPFPARIMSTSIIIGVFYGRLGDVDTAGGILLRTKEAGLIVTAGDASRPLI